ncbi:hypothetical protein KFK09_004321 [Dendrobium nobile]|uniref:Oberon PHD finger domain-containing protein n=1 Tax=Dendrobium nobile TaxID=94219 RepID=A0A8T3C5P1_DENNO|nr:hypothetical protein KFK09_004321 [Dendrobium nobile]
MTKARKLMNVDQFDGSNGNAKSSNKKIIDLKPVPACASGVGLPYAPEDWPNPGDNWTWKVGNRKAASGHWIDRFISPPGYFPKVSGCKPRFQSRVSLEKYIRSEFPYADADAFFASFTWRVPAEWTSLAGVEKSSNAYKYNGSLEVSGLPGSESAFNSSGCKAGNEMCSSMKENNDRLKVKACDICCNESDFCRDCCCILCCGNVDYANGGFSFVRCQAILEKDLICGHLAHIDCALRAYMAGTVGGSIGLDAEYYCRRCDNKTDLIQHVMKMIQICESFDSRDDIEKVLNLGSCILFGSEKVRAKKLRHSIGTIVSKLNRGINLAEIWKAENDISTISSALSGREIILLDSPENSRDDTPMESIFDVGNSFLYGKNEGELQGPLYITSDHTDVSAKLEDEIDHTLRSLKNSQESEYKIAEEKLYAQKDFLLGLYQQLEVERGDLARQTPFTNGSDSDALLTSVLSRVDQIKREEIKLKQMMRIAEGFARLPGTILRDYFDILVDD